ncbi:hypothetical protein NKH24_26735 [Mesorhizobium sp. M1300]|uniref:hypothetical protein n=1 Tax=Mesorhizobium sp. M1300 TaxID=2957077 RepID=UPI003334BB31
MWSRSIKGWTPALPAAGGIRLPGSIFDPEEDLRFARLDRLLCKALLLRRNLLARRDAQLALVLKDGAAEVAGQRWSKHRRLGLDPGIVLRQPFNCLRGWLPLSVVKLFSLLFDAQRRSLQRHHGDA